MKSILNFKKGIILFSLIISSMDLFAQIGLSMTDTTICPGQTIQMCAAVTGQADELNTDDLWSDVIDIGFPFTFFGNTYTQLKASGNAYITFTLSKTGTSPWYWGQPGYDMSNSIFAAFADWYLPDGGVIKYQHFGSPGNRKFVIEWCHIPAFYECQDLTVTTQIVLFEGSNNIEVHTAHLSPVSSSTCLSASTSNKRVVQGIIDPTGTTSYYPVNRDATGPITSNWGYNGATNVSERFTPTGQNAYQMDSIPFNPYIIIDSSNSDSLKWYAEGQLNIPIAIGSCATVTPNGSQHYYIVNYNGVVGCEDDIASVSDTVYIHYGTSYDTTSVSICNGETYNFAGRLVFQTGTYDTLFTNTSGCDSFVRLYLTVNPLPNVTATANNTSICAGDSTVLNIAEPSPNTTYQWLKNGAPVPSETGSYYIVSDAGDYTLAGITDKGCTDTSNVISIKISPAADATILGLSRSADDLCLDDTITVSAKEYANYQYHWSPEQYFRYNSSYFYPSATVTVSDTKTPIQLMAMNAFGCKAYDSMVILAHPCCDVYMPTAFTPNGDGNNDYFFPLLRPYQQIVSFRIFDRYGKLVYDNDDPQKGWNGNYPNGDKAPTDTYMYMIKYTCTDGQVYTDKNDITLVR